MNLVTVCLSVGAMSFARCEFRADSKTPLEPWYRPNDAVKSNERNETDVEPALDDAEGEHRTNPGFVQNLGLLNRIFVECKTKVNQRFKKFVKTEATSELKEYFWLLGQCVKVYGFRALDRMLQDDVIPVTSYAYFVRDGLNRTGRTWGRSGADDPPVAMKDYAAAVLSRGWAALMYDRIDALLRTHSLKFRTDNTCVSRGRSRRRDHRMFAMMVMGFMIMASILIPMGFQFLTVLGGKSLLLAKMALIMSAINGLKKIATSNVGYGFYHTGADGHHYDHSHHGFHEKHLQLHSQNYSPMQGYN